MVETILLTGLLLTMVDQSSACLPDAELLQRAEANFLQACAKSSVSRELFRRAAADYETLCRRGYANAILYLNLGNAQLQAGNLPEAILAYRRGLRLEPADRILQANLAWARSQVVFPFPGTFGRQPSSSWPYWLPRPTFRQLCFVVFLFYSLTCLAFTCWYLMRQTQLLSSALGLLLLTLILSLILFFDFQRIQSTESRPFVVIDQNGVLVRRGNGTSYPAREEGILNCGVEAYWLFTRGDWHQIELAGGEVGWVHDSQVLLDRIVPLH
jgi:tetratricopeptide (TPR) repeat protein